MVSILKTDKIQASHGTTIEIPSGHKLSGTAGSIVAPGQVIQVIQGTGSGNVETTSTSFINYAASNTSITPTNSSSKILVLMEATVGPWQNNSQDAQQRQTIYRDGTQISRIVTTRLYDYGGNGILSSVGTSINYLDSPNTTNAVTYQLYYRMVSADRAAVASASFTLLEIAQ